MDFRDAVLVELPSHYCISHFRAFSLSYARQLRELPAHLSSTSLSDQTPIRRRRPPGSERSKVTGADFALRRVLSFSQALIFTTVDLPE